MKLCNIAPAGHLRELTGQDDMHLILAHWVLNNKEYAAYYRERSEAGDYIILDNAAHEYKQSIAVELIIAAGDIVHPSEIVLPDVMRDAQKTIEATVEAFSPLREHFGNGMKYMAVAHGKTEKEWLECLRRQMQLPIDCIGIPRVYADDFGSWALAVDNTIDVSVDTDKEIDIHLLGSPHDITRLVEVAYKFPGSVRSSDSSKHIGYAINCRTLEVPLNPQQRNANSRPHNFLTYEMSPLQLEMAKYNMKVLREAIEDASNGR